MMMVCPSLLIRSHTAAVPVVVIGASSSPFYLVLSSEFPSTPALAASSAAAITIALLQRCCSIILPSSPHMQVAYNSIPHTPVHAPILSVEAIQIGRGSISMIVCPPLPNPNLKCTPASLLPPILLHIPPRTVHPHQQFSLATAFFNESSRWSTHPNCCLTISSLILPKCKKFTHTT